jgi:hypothetical protein
MRLPGHLLLAAAPLALIACAQAGGEPPPAPEAAAAAPEVDRGPQERSCAGSAAAQLGLSMSEVTAVWEAEEADGRSIVNLNAGGAVYRCVVDASGNVLNLEPVTG